MAVLISGSRKASTHLVILSATTGQLPRGVSRREPIRSIAVPRAMSHGLSCPTGQWVLISAVESFFEGGSFPCLASYTRPFLKGAPFLVWQATHAATNSRTWPERPGQYQSVRCPDVHSADLHGHSPRWSWSTRGHRLATGFPHPALPSSTPQHPT